MPGNVDKRVRHDRVLPHPWGEEQRRRLVRGATAAVLDKLDDLIRDGTTEPTERFLERAPARRGFGGELPKMLPIEKSPG